MHAQDRLTGRTFATRSVVMAQHGMACTSQPLATETAIDVLKNGGNAIDAAIAANAVLGVTDPEMNGIGGDLFAIVYDAKTKKLYGLNASGRSPYALTLDILKKARTREHSFQRPFARIRSGLCGRMVSTSWKIRKVADDHYSFLCD